MANTQILLKDIEDKIKSKNNLFREDIQNVFDRLKGKGYSLDSKKQILIDLVVRTGYKKIGIRTLVTPRQGLEETDKTFDFVDDLKSYNGWNL